jgi:hypothetical protein
MAGLVAPGKSPWSSKRYYPAIHLLQVQMPGPGSGGTRAANREHPRVAANHFCYGF